MFTLSSQQVGKINAICRSLKIGNIDKYCPQWPIWLVVEVLLNRIEGLRVLAETQSKQIKTITNDIASLQNQIQTVARNAAVSSKRLG